MWTVCGGGEPYLPTERLLFSVRLLWNDRFGWRQDLRSIHLIDIVIILDDFCGTGCQSNCDPPQLGAAGNDYTSGNATFRRIGYYEGWATQTSSRACDAYTPEQISAETLTHGQHY